MNKWVEIDLDAIKNNFIKVREYVEPETKVLGVVKADAYGHGLVEVSQELEKQGVDYLGVTEIEEGIKLRQGGIEVPILVFGPFLPEDAHCFQEYDLTATLADLASVKNILTLNLKIRAHIKIETGLGRTGFKYSELPELLILCKDQDNIEIEGAYSHLATSMWTNTTFLKEQFAKFLKALEFFKVNELELPLKHLCNSAALMRFPEMHLDMVRAGTVLYGQEIKGQKELEGKLQSAWTLKGRIIYINELPPGHSVGYERAHIFKAKGKTALVPIGFKDGFSVEPIPRPCGILDLIKVLGKTILRYFGHPRMRTYVRIGDKFAPVVGKVGMQLTILDVTSISDLKVGQIVELPGRRTNISPELPKVFVYGSTTSLPS